MALNPPIPDLVSTIVPVHNRPVLLREAVDSILAQTYRPIEIIIVDDGSTDETPGVIDDLVQTNPSLIRSLSILNGGPGVAREAGRRIAKGEFIQYLDSDDVLLPSKFEVQVAALRREPETGVAYGKTVYCDLGAEIDWTPWKRTGEKIGAMLPSLLQSRWWGTSTPLYRRNVTDQAGGWLSLRNEEDWEYDCRIAKAGVLLAFCDVFVSVEREHAGERLSRGGAIDPSKLKDRAQAHTLILNHAIAGGVARDSVEMKHFRRAIFLLCRQCAAVGLVDQARDLLRAAARTSARFSRDSFEFKTYQVLSQVIGWRSLARIALVSDRLRG